MKLSERLKSWRAERPDEWTMDEFIRLAEVLEKENFRLAAGQCVHILGVVGDDHGHTICPATLEL